MSDQELHSAGEEQSVERESSSRHHSHHRRRRKHRLSKFVKKNKKTLINIGIFALALVMVIALAVAGDLYNKGKDVSSQPTDSTAPSEIAGALRIEIPFFTEAVQLLPSQALQYINRDLSEPAVKAIDIYNPNRERLDHDLPVRLTFGVKGLPAGYTVASAMVEVCTNSSFVNPRIFNLRSGEYSVDVNHLMADTRYYFRISITLSDGSVNAVQGSFKTAAAPRILYVDGINNVRDIGGWKTTDGKTIRQGLLYRGSELDGAVEPAFKITAQGVNDMLTEFGIRTDLDLRAPTDNIYGTHALGANVEHIYHSASDYAYIFEEYGSNIVRDIFADLADESRYPIYMHCTYGLDRTGTICYLLEALLGMSEEDLQREYELSALYNGWVDTKWFNEFVTALQALEGDTMQQKVEGYLLSTGVTAEQIETIREIFLED